MLDIKQLYIKTVAISLICLTGLSVVFAQETAKQETSISCLKLNRISNVDIIDNKNIVFQTMVNNYYLNTLPYACSGLRMNDSFMYRTSLDEICNVDMITVLDNNAGLEFQGGPSCGLGRFEPISKEEIKTLKDSLKQKVSAR